jgi:hypothetical protein
MPSTHFGFASTFPPAVQASRGLVGSLASAEPTKKKESRESGNQQDQKMHARVRRLWIGRGAYLIRSTFHLARSDAAQSNPSHSRGLSAGLLDRR